MAQDSRFYIVEASALPEIFLKVAEAKELISTGVCGTVGDAVRQVGISRSAFYKYKDSIAPMQNLMAGRILTFQMLLQDKSGVLSSILTVFAEAGANILTINQSIPQNRCAVVTISAETGDLNCALEELLQKISGMNGVVHAEIVAG